MKPVLFAAGFVFHILAGVLFGIWSFVLVMLGALTFLLLPNGTEGLWQKMNANWLMRAETTRNEGVGSLM